MMRLAFAVLPLPVAGRMHRFWMQLLATLMLLGAAQAFAQTVVSGPIVAHTRWTAANSPYVVAGDVKRSRFGTTSTRRWFDLPLTEVAPPGPDVVGSTSTWEPLVAEFGSWTAVLAEFGTWEEVAEHVADPDVVIVP